MVMLKTNQAGFDSFSFLIHFQALTIVIFEFSNKCCIWARAIARAFSGKQSKSAATLQGILDDFALSLKTRGKPDCKSSVSVYRWRSGIRYYYVLSACGGGIMCSLNILVVNLTSGRNWQVLLCLDGQH
jgi:hypothetical protein